MAYHVNETLSKALGVRMQGGNASIFSDMVDKGFLGVSIQLFKKSFIDGTILAKER